MTTRMWWLALAVPLLIAALGYGALRYMTAVPGTPHRGALPPLTAEETALAAALARHIGVIAAHEHNVAHYDELETVARYLETTLESLGYSVGRQVFTADGKPVRNIDVTIEPPAGRSDPEVVVVGAHYDSARGTPGANDNATGAAAVLELARLMRDLKGVSGKRIRLVLFVNEEPPYFMTEAMGSLNYARALAARHERVVAMYSLETIGFYSSAPGSQSYPAPFGLMFADRGDFVAFVGMLGSRRAAAGDGAVVPLAYLVPDHRRGGAPRGARHRLVGSRAFAEHGFQAVMVTDTALFRYPHYHQPTDTPDKIDTEKLARVVKGIERVVRDAAR